MTLSTRFLRAYGLLALIVGCAGGNSDGAGGVSVGTSQTPPEDNFPAKPVSFKWQLQSAPPTAVPFVALADPAPFFVQSAYGNLRSIRLALPADIDCGEYGSWVTSVSSARAGSCAQESTEAIVRFEGPDEVALAASSPTSSYSNLALPIGNYSWIELRVDDADTATAHISPDASMVLIGSYGTTPTSSVHIAVSVNREIRYAAPGGFAIDATGGSSLVVNIDSSAWFTGVSAALAECLDGSASFVPGDAIVVSAESDTALECDAVEETLKNNLEGAGRFEQEELDDTESDDTPDSEDAPELRDSPVFTFQ